MQILSVIKLETLKDKIMNNNKINRSSKKLSMALGLGVAFACFSATVTANDSANLSIKSQTASGSPAFMSGELGQINNGNAAADLKNFLSSNPAYQSSGSEGFTIKRQWTDTLGKQHTHFSQTLNGLKVYGTSMIMHTNVGSSGLTASNSLNSSGQLYAVSGRLARDSFPALKPTGYVQAQSKAAVHAASDIGKVLAKPELAYIYLADSDETKLAWRVEVTWDNGNHDFGRDFVYISPYTTELLARHPQIHSAKSWKTYTLNGGSANSAPGTLLCTNNQSCGSNSAAQRAHDGASITYDYYNSRFGRDSINDNGLTLKSSVDMGEANAYWTGAQMIYGAAANGLNDFTSDYDVIGHELTHGVTDYTADLIYQNASGALNEAWSDILGLSAEAYRNGTSSSSWLLGDGLYNNQPGKALRYMDDPTKDNYSKDYYPERIPFVSNPNNSNDQGGVHGNSGIANLAYVLLVDGGSHPRGKTNEQVPAIGMAKAEQIFYRALVTYMSQSTDFFGARSATIQAAQDLYGATEVTALESAWCAVGVGNCPNSGGGGGGNNQLTNGVTVSNLAASTGSDIVYTLEVPAGATDISFVISGGSGDADMYVKFGSTPTDSSYDCRPYVGGNNETCNVTSSGGTYYIRVKAYQTFSGVSLVGSYTAAGGGGGSGPTPVNETVANISINRGSWSRYTVNLGSGYSNLTVEISGGSGDVDLYVNQGTQSTTSSYDCRPYKNGNNETCTFSSPAADTWYIDLYGYSTSSGVTLTIAAD